MRNASQLIRNLRGSMDMDVWYGYVEGEEKLFALTFLTVAPLIHILHVWDMQKSCLLGNFL